MESLLFVFGSVIFVSRNYKNKEVVLMVDYVPKLTTFDG